MIKALQSGNLDVNDPKVTRRLLELNAVVGVIGKIADDHIKSIGVTCALCHSTVDNSLATGIGHRLDGWPNLDLDVGKIAAAAPGFPDGLREEFHLGTGQIRSPSSHFRWNEHSFSQSSRYALAAGCDSAGIRITRCGV